VTASTIDPFRPAWWLPSPHGQTIGARAIRRRSGVALERERLDTPDGDFLDLDWAHHPAGGDRPLLVLFHGLEGSARSGYAYSTYRQAHAQGLDAVGVNFRSCSGELNRGLRLYHSGETSDPRWVLALLADRFPGRPLGAVGFSLGGNALLKLLGEDGSATPLTAACAISVPFDLAAGGTLLERGLGPGYVWSLLRPLKQKVRLRAADLGPLIDLERSLAARSFRDFDDAATAPLHGFDGADDYYRRCSSAAFVERIVTPTLVLHSRGRPLPAARRDSRGRVRGESRPPGAPHRPGWSRRLPRRAGTVASAVLGGGTGRALAGRPARRRLITRREEIARGGSGSALGRWRGPAPDPSA
jgi:predicted alpha/beta-fold hydrolase